MNEQTNLDFCELFNKYMTFLHTTLLHFSSNSEFQTGSINFLFEQFFINLKRKNLIKMKIDSSAKCILQNVFNYLKKNFE